VQRYTIHRKKEDPPGEWGNKRDNKDKYAYRKFTSSKARVLF